MNRLAVCGNVIPMTMRMMTRTKIRNGSYLATCLLVLVLAEPAVSGELMQPGFYYHDPEDVSLKLSNAQSGPVCSTRRQPSEVCEKAIKVVITGDETCEYSATTHYPCTRFGYEFDFEGATPGAAIQCDVKRTDPMGRETTDRYEHALKRSSGHVLYPTYRTYAPVDERMILSEVHECRYDDELLATIEFIIYYEPGETEKSDRPAFFEVPYACGEPYLPTTVATGLLNGDAKPSAANEHVPELSSQCFYSSRGTSARETGLVFKFMLSDMFNVETVPSAQLRFNATFAAGGAQLKETRKGLGDMAFVFEKGGRTTLMVITGVGGRDDFAGRRTELIALYYLDRPELEPDTRLAKLLPLAHEHVRVLQEQ